MEQILHGYGLSKEMVSPKMILYRNSQSMVVSFNGDTEFFDVVTEVLQGDTLSPYLFPTDVIKNYKCP